MPPPTFQSRKVTEAAGQLLKLGGGSMFYIMLLKLLYLVDRAALQRFGKHVSNDRHVSMDNGPVLSCTYNLIRESPAAPPSYWRQHIEKRGLQVALLSDPGCDHLSEAESDLIQEVFTEYGHWDRFALIEHMHRNFGEWTDPEGSSIPIAIHKILEAQGAPRESAMAVENELTAMRELSSLYQ